MRACVAAYVGDEYENPENYHDAELLLLLPLDGSAHAADDRHDAAAAVGAPVYPTN